MIFQSFDLLAVTEIILQYQDFSGSSGRIAAAVADRINDAILPGGGRVNVAAGNDRGVQFGIVIAPN